jgi:hypothetical protein
MANPTDLGDVVALQLESLALSESSMRTSFDWAGENYTCSGGPEYGGKRLGDGGWRMNARLRIKVRVEIFPDGVSIPKEKQIIYYHRNFTADPKPYRIDALTNCFGAWLELECIHPDEGG